MDNKSIGIAILIGLGVLGFWFFTRKAGLSLPMTAPLRLQPAGSITNGMLHYKNRETRNIEWDENSLPSKIVIEREYYQLP